MSWRKILKNTNTKNKENKENQNNDKSNITYFPYILGIFKSEKYNITDSLQETSYIFYERLGISNNPELAFEEAINWLKNKLISNGIINNNNNTDNNEVQNDN